jgi:hypothetical protein
MKIRIEVESRKEGELIRAGLQHPETRALVKVMGALAFLPTDRARARVFWYVKDACDEAAEGPQEG